MGPRGPGGALVSNVHMLKLRRCVDMPVPPVQPSGQTKCERCTQDCWLSRGSVELLAKFPLLILLCTHCAEIEHKTNPPTIVAQVPRNQFELLCATELLAQTGAVRIKGGQA